jgi:NDP-sugar pyrophosphorylase family protein
MKYEILKNDHKTFLHPYTENPVRVFRIIYVSDVTWTNPFTDTEHTISAGTIGGFIASEVNLSHTDTSVILNNAIVFGNATLKDTFVRDSASVFDDCSVIESEVFGTSRIFGKTKAKNCIFRDTCNVGGMLDLERCYITNSANISGVCRIHDTSMYVGSIIRGQCNVYDCQLTDVSEICGISTIRNCRLSGRVFLKNANVQNQSFNETIQLSVTQKEGDLFPH